MDWHGLEPGNVGRVRIYRWRGLEWQLLGSTCHGFLTANVLAKARASFSGDGRIIAVGGDRGNYSCVVPELWDELGPDRPNNYSAGPNRSRHFGITTT